MKHASGINFIHESRRRLSVFGDDSFSMPRAVRVDMRNSFIKVADDFDRNNRPQVFGSVIGLGRRTGSRQQLPRSLRIVVLKIAVRVRRDVGAEEEGFAGFEEDDGADHDEHGLSDAGGGGDGNDS